MFICRHRGRKKKRGGGPFFELWGRGSQGVFGVALNEIPPSGSVGGAILFELEQKQISILRQVVSLVPIVSFWGSEKSKNRCGVGCRQDIEVKLVGGCISH